MTTRTAIATPDPPRSVTVRSTTGTAPIVVHRDAPGLVLLTFEDGSAQVYSAADLLAAIGAVST